MKEFVNKLNALMIDHDVDFSMLDASKLNGMFVSHNTREDFDIRHLLPNEYKDRIDNLT